MLSQITTLGQAPVEGSGPEVTVIEGFAFAGGAAGGRCSPGARMGPVWVSADWGGGGEAT